MYETRIITMAIFFKTVTGTQLPWQHCVYTLVPTIVFRLECCLTGLLPSTSAQCDVRSVIGFIQAEGHTAAVLLIGSTTSSDVTDFIT